MLEIESIKEERLAMGDESNFVETAFVLSWKYQEAGGWPTRCVHIFY